MRISITTGNNHEVTDFVLSDKGGSKKKSHKFHENIYPPIDSYFLDLKPENLSHTICKTHQDLSLNHTNFARRDRIQRFNDPNDKNTKRER